MAAARARSIDAIAVVKLDRWGRSLADLVTSMQELVELKVAFVSVADSIDLTTAAGQALAGMLSVFAQFERQLIIERVRSGMNHAKKHGTRSGKAIGRPATIAGRATEIRALAHEGLSMAAIARKLDLGYASVHRVLAGSREEKAGSSTGRRGRRDNIEGKLVSVTHQAKDVRHRPGGGNGAC